MFRYKPKTAVVPKVTNIDIIKPKRKPPNSLLRKIVPGVTGARRSLSKEPTLSSRFITTASAAVVLKREVIAIIPGTS